MSVKISVFPIMILAVAGCAAGPASGDRGPGAVVTADGRFVANTAANHRDEVCRHLADDLAAAAGEGWKVTATIAELPQYRASAVDPMDGDWYWSAATVRLAFVGEGTPKVGTAEAEDGVRRYMAKRVRGGAAHVVVTSSLSAPAAPQAAAALAASPTAGGTYVIQQGDTLAAITSLFYGSPEGWRAIVTANPGLDPANLPVGTRITIPPKP